MPPSKFTASRQVAIAAAVGEGVSIPDAARGNDVSPETVKTWLKKGRKDPAGEYGEFARLVDEGLAARVLDEGDDRDDPIPPEDELLRRLDAASRKGSVRATQLLLEFRTRKDKQDGDEDADDGFGELESPPDELAQARSRRSS